MKAVLGAVTIAVVTVGPAAGAPATSHTVVGAGQGISCYLTECSPDQSLWIEATDSAGGSGEAIYTRFPWEPAVALWVTSLVIDSPLGAASDYHEIHGLATSGSTPYCIELRVANRPDERDYFSIAKVENGCTSFVQTDALDGLQLCFMTTRRRTPARRPPSAIRAIEGFVTSAHPRLSMPTGR